MSKTRSSFSDKLATVKEMLAFIWQGRHWWLTPIIVIILLLSVLVVFLESSALAPFIYALF